MLVFAKEQIPQLSISSKNTRKAIANYQVDKALTVNGRMTTELLNSLGIPAVNFVEDSY